MGLGGLTVGRQTRKSRPAEAGRRYILWGATGQAIVLRELVGPGLVAVFDRDRDIRPPFDDVPLMHESDFDGWLREPAPAFLVAIGGHRGADRLERQGILEERGLRAMTAVHQTAYVAGSIGAGSQILAHGVVAARAELGRSVIVNTAATVDHECRLGDGVHIGPGAHLAGLVDVGECAFVGTGAVVLPRIRIGANAIVGAGAVVTRDVPDGATVVGNPARIRGPALP